MNIFFGERLFFYIEDKIKIKNPSYSIKDRVPEIARKTFALFLLGFLIYIPFALCLIITS